MTAERFHPGASIPGVVQHNSGKAFIGPDQIYPGDWVIVNEKGEFEVCEPELFAAAYDPDLVIDEEKRSRPVKGAPCKRQGCENKAATGQVYCSKGCAPYANYGEDW